MSSQSTMSVWLRRRMSPPVDWERRTNSCEITQSPRLLDFSMATSSMVAVPEPSSSTTVRSNSSPTARVSAPRCSKRRRFTSPVEMIWSASMLVTRVMGTNTRFFPRTSTTSPTTRGRVFNDGRLPGRSSTTTSRSRPRRSPRGSKTSRPISRATKILERFVLTRPA